MERINMRKRRYRTVLMHGHMMHEVPLDAVLAPGCFDVNAALLTAHLHQHRGGAL